MKVAVLSRNPALYSTLRIAEACRRRGHQIDVLDTLRFSVLLERSRSALYYDDRPVESYDAVIPRIGASVTMQGTLVVQQFEQLGVLALNGARAIALSRDKLGSIQALANEGVPVPPTAFASSSEGVLMAIEQMGGAPVIVKLLEGAQGIGVILAESANTADAIVQTLRSKRQNALIQRFVRESRGRDIRAFVVGDRVIGAVRRIAQGDEFRSNIHRGGHAEPVTLDRAYEQTALRAARVVGLDVAGVDLLEADDGPRVAEVNSSPGLEGIEGATGIDVAAEIALELERQAEPLRRNEARTAGARPWMHFRRASGRSSSTL